MDEHERKAVEVGGALVRAAGVLSDMLVSLAIGGIVLATGYVVWYWPKGDPLRFW
jgi:hypothetical protein